MAYRNVFPAVFLGLGGVLLIALSFSLMTSLFLTFTSYTEESIGWLITTVAFLALFIGGFMAGTKAKSKGMMVGALTALLFSLVTFLVQFLGYNEAFTNGQYMFHGLYLLVAAIGGIIGVNLSSQSEK
ncbi:TIGR04086 family membrane protein [Bacillus sp. FJAT-45037]|uniref:TIGR04086 family membrane protein n=1 Tax=Bacillus sp. FJAT-45037 TaxID=2011007 RepID=UPI000C24088F|nr:TIGR04086 family membrane protein [Bacillus sp. FJAT-45037]